MERLITLGYNNPELRKHLRPILDVVPRPESPVPEPDLVPETDPEPKPPQEPQKRFERLMRNAENIGIEKDR